MVSAAVPPPPPPALGHSLLRSLQGGLPRIRSERGAASKTIALGPHKTHHCRSTVVVEAEIDVDFETYDGIEEICFEMLHDNGRG